MGVRNEGFFYMDGFEEGVPMGKAVQQFADTIPMDVYTQFYIRKEYVDIVPQENVPSISQYSNPSWGAAHRLDDMYLLKPGMESTVQAFPRSRPLVDITFSCCGRTSQCKSRCYNPLVKCFMTEDFHCSMCSANLMSEAKPPCANCGNIFYRNKKVVKGLGLVCYQCLQYSNTHVGKPRPLHLGCTVYHTHFQCPWKLRLSLNSSQLSCFRVLELGTNHKVHGFVNQPDRRLKPSEKDFADNRGYLPRRDCSTYPADFLKRLSSRRFLQRRRVIRIDPGIKQNRRGRARIRPIGFRKRGDKVVPIRQNKHPSFTVDMSSAISSVIPSSESISRLETAETLASLTALQSQNKNSSEELEEGFMYPVSSSCYLQISDAPLPVSNVATLTTRDFNDHSQSHHTRVVSRERHEDDEEPEGEESEFARSALAYLRKETSASDDMNQINPDINLGGHDYSKQNNSVMKSVFTVPENLETSSEALSTISHPKQVFPETREMLSCNFLHHYSIPNESQSVDQNQEKDSARDQSSTTLISQSDLSTYYVTNTSESSSKLRHVHNEHTSTKRPEVMLPNTEYITTRGNTTEDVFAQYNDLGDDVGCDHVFLDIRTKHLDASGQILPQTIASVSHNTTSSSSAQSSYNSISSLTAFSSPYQDLTSGKDLGCLMQDTSMDFTQNSSIIPQTSVTTNLPPHSLMLSANNTPICEFSVPTSCIASTTIDLEAGQAASENSEMTISGGQMLALPPVLTGATISGSSEAISTLTGQLPSHNIYLLSSLPLQPSLESVSTSTILPHTRPISNVESHLATTTFLGQSSSSTKQPSFNQAIILAGGSEEEAPQYVCPVCLDSNSGQLFVSPCLGEVHAHCLTAHKPVPKPQKEFPCIICYRRTGLPVLFSTQEESMQHLSDCHSSLVSQRHVCQSQTSADGVFPREVNKKKLMNSSTGKEPSEMNVLESASQRGQGRGGVRKRGRPRKNYAGFTHRLDSEQIGMIGTDVGTRLSEYPLIGESTEAAVIGQFPLESSRKAFTIGQSFPNESSTRLATTQPDRPMRLSRTRPATRFRDYVR